MTDIQAHLDSCRKLLERGNCRTQLTCDLEQMNVESYNGKAGNLGDYDCQACKNKGYIAFLRDGVFTLKRCACDGVRRSYRRIRMSGLSGVIEQYTFDRYIASEPWQELAKEKAMGYLENPNGQWFYFGGAVGCGKTHLCTAITSGFMQQGKTALYMLWRDEIMRLKLGMKDEQFYSSEIARYKTVDVLYIDDLFKTEQGRNPTQADVNTAFEIINYRYMNPQLITVFSSERLIDELLGIDEAVGSRIYQRAKQSCINIKPDRSKNYRLK